jgi:hypothetical protein
LLVVCEKGYEVADIDVGRIARCEIFGKSNTPLHALEDRVAQRAALRDDRDGTPPVPHAAIVGHEVQSRASLRVRKSDAIRTGDANAEPPSRRHDAFLLLDALRLSSFAEPRRIDDRSASAHRSSGFDHPLNHRPGDTKDHAVRRLGEIAQARNARAIEQVSVFRVDGVNLPGKFGHIGQGALSK